MRLRKSASAAGQSLRRLTSLTLWLKWGRMYALPKERLAQRLRYCRIMPMKRRNAPPRTAGQELYAPWTAHINYIFLLVLCRFICLRLTVVLHCRIHICIHILRLSENGITRSNLAHSYLITITDVFLIDSKHTC